MIVVPTTPLFDKNLHVLWADVSLTSDIAVFLTRPLEIMESQGISVPKLGAFKDSTRYVAEAMCHYALELSESKEGHEFVFLFPLWALAQAGRGQTNVVR